MTLNARDKKIVMLLVPVMLVAAYWFLVLTPKREEAAKLGETLVAAESRRDSAEDALRQAEASKSDYAGDYATVVRLGKAIPSDVDMPSLLVQLDRAAAGTNIRFAKIAAGPRAAAPVAPAPASDGSSAEAPASDAGGSDATSGPGQATEAANEGAAAADGSGDAAAGAAGSPAAGTTTPTSAPTALDTVPLTFAFDGRFADLADFFHEMKRFVRVANDRVQVDGRLMKIDGFTFDSSKFPTITANVNATVYLAPKAQGATAGATPEGPATTTTPAPAAAPAAPAPATPAAPAPAPPAPAAPVAQGAPQ